MKSATNGLLSSHLTGQAAENGPHTRDPNLWPALLRRYRDLPSLRHDYPLILVGDGSGRGIESLTAVINDLLPRVAPPGPEGGGTRRRVLRLEKEIRSLVFQKETGPLSRLWSMATARLSAQPNLPTEEKRLLQQDLNRAWSALNLEGQVIGCDADTADRVLRHLWSRRDEARAGRIRSQLRELTIPLHDLLRSDDLESEEARQPEALERAFGSWFDQLIDFQAMARTLHGVRAHPRMPAKRRERIEWALKTLRAQRFFAADEDNDRYEFVFASCSSALADFKRRIPAMVDLVKAIRIAALEVENRYRDETHDRLFASFSFGSLTAEDIRWFPSYFVSLREVDCDAADRAESIEILSSDLPIKLVFQVDQLFHEIAGQRDPLSDAPWRTQLASMAVNLGSAFVLQAATSNLFPMAERLAVGLAAPGPALFFLFAPGEDSHPKLPPYLTAAAAIESRLFPTLVFDPKQGGTLAECFSLDGNPQSDRDWPTHAFTYEDDQMQALTENLCFTAVDFLAADPAFAEFFQPVPRREWNDRMVPLAQYLQAGNEENRGRVPIVLVVGPNDRLQRMVVTSAAVQFAQRIARRWHNLQELGGINNSHVRRALAEARQAWECEKREVAEISLTSTPAQPEPVDTEKGIAPPAVAAPAVGKVEPAAPASRDEAWIETSRCTSCNECTKRNNRRFKYNENKQACIADLHAGTYRELVEAAESCKVAIIHPGKPWNPKEPGLEELRQRAEPFR